MGDQQIISELPVENVIGEACVDACGPGATYCSPASGGNICSRAPWQEPSGGINCSCTIDCCYQQPPRQPMCRPEVSYLRPTAPIETDTIYKRSYIGNDGCGRVAPIRIKDSIKPLEGRMDANTIQKLSYPPHCDVPRVPPIRPTCNGLRFDGPYHDLTSQKHDYGPKCYSKRLPIKVADGILKCCAPLERCTVNKLSYMPYDICSNPPPKPIIQTGNYILPDGPGERCTVQKLSYMPVPLPPKEDMPWAKSVRVEPPRSRPLYTTYKLSYIPNCHLQRIPPIIPISAMKTLGSETADNNTVYKLSYTKTCGTKPDPIMPRSGICLPSGVMEKCTVYKLSYQPQGCPERTKPIRPRENMCKSNAPIQGMTTQKHDFVPKSCSRRGLIVPPTSMCTPSYPMEKFTINKLSYLPVSNPIKSCPILPRPGLSKFDAPLSKCTTYKLSYMPVPIPPKEPLPWAGKSSCVRPTAPIERCTIQKLSYGAPGTFMRKGNCGCCCAIKNATSSYSKAAVCG